MQFVSVVLQIIIESLPVSSSGHAQLLGLSLPDSIDRLTGGATVIVLMIYFFRDIVFWINYGINKPKKIFSFLLLIMMADSVTVFLYTLLKAVSPVFPLWFGFLITALALLSLAWRVHDAQKNIDYKSFFLIGLVQGIACLPGISRLATTYTAAAWSGYPPAVAFRISCALQIPLFAAGFLEGLHTLWPQRFALQIDLLHVVMIIGAMIGAYLLLWLVEKLMKSHTLWYLGWYMFIPVFVAYIRGM